MAKTAKPKSTPLSDFISLRESGEGLRRSEAVDGGRVFKGVTIIRSGLGNRRDRNYYPPDVLKDAVETGLFEGLKAYADHPTSVDEEIQPERTVRDFVGLYTNTKFRENRVTGDLRILRAHKWLSDVVDELIEIGAADKIGLSINGRGATVPGKARLEESGDEVDVNEVRKFIDLRSADVVTEAGAGGGFPQILESARGAAAKETGMTKKSDILKKLQEAAKAGDLEEVQRLTAQLTEATAKPKVEDTEEPEADEVEGEEAETEEAETEDDEDDEEDPEAKLDAELEDAVESAKGTEDDEEDDEDLEESEDCDDLEEGCGGKKGKKMVAEAKGPLAKGVSMGGGSMTKKAGNRYIKGRKFGEADVTNELHALRVENARLAAKLDKVANRNERLAEALSVSRKADAARKLLKESGIPAELRADLVDRLVRLPNEDAMRREIRFHQRLVESAAKRVRDEIDEFDEVEGAGSTIRESYAGNGNEDVDELLAGLPTRKK